jgi:HEAT repeat protein
MHDKPDEVWIGPVGPVPIVRNDNSRRLAANAASSIAQAAIGRDDLIALVLDHPDPLVRMEAVPCLKARFPSDSRTQDALMNAVTDVDESVRCEAISAIADLALPLAGDLLAAALQDAEPDVRFFAALGLQQLGDARAPDDPQGFAYHGNADSERG